MIANKKGGLEDLCDLLKLGFWGIGTALVLVGGIGLFVDGFADGIEDTVVGMSSRTTGICSTIGAFSIIGTYSNVGIGSTVATRSNVGTRSTAGTWSIVGTC